MNAHDAQLWTSGREKVDAGLPLTDAERDVLLFYGGERMLRRHEKLPTKVTARPQRLRATKSDAPIHRADMAGKLYFADMTGKLRFDDIGTIESIRLRRGE